MTWPDAGLCLESLHRGLLPDCLSLRTDLSSQARLPVACGHAGRLKTLERGQEVVAVVEVN